MATSAQPAMRPARPQFSSGPCAKRPGWRLENLGAAVARSFAPVPGAGKTRLQEAIERTRAVLEIPGDFLVGIVPGSDTGAMGNGHVVDAGPVPIQLLAFESFGKDWVTDVVKQLRLGPKCSRRPMAPFRT